MLEPGAGRGRPPAARSAVYDLSLGADRMVLGLRGQMSEMELDQSIQRMVEARWNKARRGEVMTVPPAGYEIDDRNQWVITSDEAVFAPNRGDRRASSRNWAVRARCAWATAPLCPWSAC